MNHPTALEKCIIAYMKEIIELNFSGENFDVLYHIDNTLFKLFINFPNGTVVIEIDNDDPDFIVIYAKITNTKILGLLDLASNYEIFNAHVPCHLQAIADGDWIDAVITASECIKKKAKEAGIK